MTAEPRIRATIPWAAAFVTLALHLAGNAHYGFFRDELYFIICGRSPQFGYVDQPPVVPLLAALTQLGGHSLFLLRAVPALCAAGGAYATASLALEFGGGAFAQVLATIAFIGAPVLLNFGTKVSPDETGLWLWPLIALWLVRITRGADPRWWLAIGTAAGFAGESKYTALFFFIALFAGLLLTPERRVLRSRWFLAGMGLGVAIVVPNFIWQAANGFPMWELLEAGQHGKNVIAGPLLYVLQQIVITNPYLAPLWIVGLVWLLRTPRFRFLGYAYLVMIVQMLALHGKHYYPADIYPILIAAGAATIARWTPNAAVWRAAVTAYAAAFALLSVPLNLPVLNEAQLVSYETSLLARLDPIPRAAMATQHDEAPAIGSDYGDMHGWPELAAAARDAYDALPPQERAQAVVYALDYGQASALRFFAPGVPTISGHNQFWLWGYGNASGNVILELGGTCFQSAHAFAHHRVAVNYVTALPVMGYENHLRFMVCSGRLIPMATLWKTLKHYE